MTRAGLLVSIVIGGLAVAGVAAQRGPGIPPSGAIERIKDNLYKIPGAGGNTVVFVTQAGVVLVDTKLATDAETKKSNGELIMNQVRTVTDKPVTTIINTHSHPDHIGSNNYFDAAVQVVTHENTRKWMAANPAVASNPVVMPDRTYTDKLTLGSGRDRIDLYWFGAGHTDGDALVVFPSVRTMMAGDIFAWNMAPLIDPAAGGSVIALPDTLEKAVKGIRDVDTVIEGHGNVNTWLGFRTYTEFNRALLTGAKAGLGKQAPEAIANGLRAKFPELTHERLLAGMEYGGTPLSRAVINVNVAFQELRGEPVTTNFGPRRGGGPAVPRGGGAAPPPPAGGRGQ
jgi:cyclase